MRKLALKINRSHVLYVVWLFLCFNVYILQEISSESERDDSQVTTVKKIDRSLLRPAQIKKILLWNPWYGDFGFPFDDEAAFA